MLTTAVNGRPALSRAAIVAAARRIADDEGIGALTLRRIAAEFDTGQASLYRHIANRAELLSLLADDLIASYPIVTDEDTDPATVVIRQWQAIHDHLTDHPWAARLIADGEHLGQGVEHLSAPATGQLRRAGLDPDDAALAYRAIWLLLLGHLLNAHPFDHPARHGKPPGKPKTDADGFSWALRRLLAGALSESRP